MEWRTGRPPYSPSDPASARRCPWLEGTETQKINKYFDVLHPVNHGGSYQGETEMYSYHK